MLATGMIRLGLDDFVEELDLVDGGFGVVCSRANDFERNMLIVVVVAREPNGGEVAPAQLAHNGVFAILELLANLDRVVAALAVIFRIFFVSGIFGGVVGGGG